MKNESIVFGPGIVIEPKDIEDLRPDSAEMRDVINDRELKDKKLAERGVIVILPGLHALIV